MTRITYWTTACLEPDIEAVSKEVVDLAQHFTDCRIFSISRHLGVTVREGGRVLGFNPAWDPLLRLGIPLLEKATSINHVYSEVSPWIYLRTLRRRPIVMTIASEHGAVSQEFLQRCSAVIVQTEGMRRKLAQLDLGPGKVRLIYPGVDLSHFRPFVGRERGKRINVLLATFPRTEVELGPRGVDFLLDMAAAMPQVDFTLASRPWSGGSTALDAVKQAVQARGLTNVSVLEGVQKDMTALYRSADFTVVPFTTADGGKECPRSLVESLACGVPVLISHVAPFSNFVRENACGVAFELTNEGFADAISKARESYATLSTNAAHCAQSNFDKQSMLRAYAAIYSNVALGSGPG